MKRISLIRLGTLLLFAAIGLTSCKKDYKNPEKNAYKILGVWTPERYIVHYVDFSGVEKVYEKTNFERDIWEFYQKGNFRIDPQMPEVGSTYYEYTISETALTIGKKPYTLETLNNSTLRFSKTSEHVDTAVLDGQAVGIIQHFEWSLRK